MILKGSSQTSQSKFPIDEAILGIRVRAKCNVQSVISVSSLMVVLLVGLTIFDTIRWYEYDIYLDRYGFEINEF